MVSPRDNYEIHDRGETAVRFWDEDYQLIARTRQALGCSTFKETALLSLKHRLNTLPTHVESEDDGNYPCLNLLQSASQHQAEYGDTFVSDLLGLFIGVLRRAYTDPDKGRQRLESLRSALHEAMEYSPLEQDRFEVES